MKYVSLLFLFEIFGYLQLFDSIANIIVLDFLNVYNFLSPEGSD